jgi:choline dehydrogenase-like flavoprotein
MNDVGGTSLHYWAQSWRLNPWDFRVISETTRRYGASRLPKGTTVEDWPFGLDELEPYYDRVEYEVGISGQAGNISGIIDQRGMSSQLTKRTPKWRGPTPLPLPSATSGPKSHNHCAAVLRRRSRHGEVSYVQSERTPRHRIKLTIRRDVLRLLEIPEGRRGPRPPLAVHRPGTETLAVEGLLDFTDLRRGRLDRGNPLVT